MSGFDPGDFPDADDAASSRASERVTLAKALELRGIDTPRVLDAIQSVPRHLFVPESHAAAAYEDRALPIAHEQTISQPYIVAFMTALLDLERTSRVLEVGTGSGYQAAVLSELCDEVYSIEIIEELSRGAGRVLEDLGRGSVRLRVGDGSDGWSEHAPYDAIVVTAAAPAVPGQLVKQLARGGRMVMPLAGPGRLQWIWVVERDGEGIVTRRRTIPVRFVEMTGKVQSSDA